MNYRFRRALNWIPLGLSYAFLYMGRYNLTVAKTALGENLTKAEFGTIFGIGAWVYAVSFLITGPLTDRIGGRRSILIGSMGSIVSNALMGLILFGISVWGWNISLFIPFTFLYAINMHFQSYGAIAIVSINAPWFRVSERGTFSTIFGTMIAMGVFFAFDWGYALVDVTRATISGGLSFWATIFNFFLGVGGQGVDKNWWLFFTPSILLAVIWLFVFLFVKNRPEEAGFPRLDTGEGSVSSSGERLPVKEVFIKIITHPVLFFVCGIEFCSGILRNGIMHWYPIFASEMGFKKFFPITANWGLVLLLAGVFGSMLTGWASDKFFQSRRAPMACILYALMFFSVIFMASTLSSSNYWFSGMSAFLISMAVIGVHGIMSGTSTADFGGSKNVGSAVGIVDGMVYLGTGVQSLIIGNIVPVGELAKSASNWVWWPVFLVPFSLLGFFFALKIWNAFPKRILSKATA